MKVCYCLATTDLEGGAKSLLDLLTNINKDKNIESYVILTKHHKDLEEKLNNINVQYKIILHGTDCKTKSKLKQFIKIIINKIAKYRMKKFFISKKIDIIHNNSVISLIAMEAAYESNIPYICHVRENIEDGLGLEMLNYDKLYNLMNKSYCCIYISNSVKKRYQKYVNCNNRVIYDGLEFEKYIINKNLNELNFNKIIMVGRICKTKGQMDAVKAINMLVNKYKKNYHLVIIGSIGESDYYNQILDYINKNNIKSSVKILEYSDSLRKLRKENDVALICSENEGLGRVTVEAMLSNQLVIGAKSGATSEIITNNETGFLYELHNIEQLANIILNLDKNNSKKIVSNAYNYAIKTFDNNNETNKVKEIYYDILRR